MADAHPRPASGREPDASGGVPGDGEAEQLPAGVDTDGRDPWRPGNPVLTQLGLLLAMS